MDEIKILVEQSNGQIETFEVPRRPLSIRKSSFVPKMRIAIFINEDKVLLISSTNPTLFYETVGFPTDNPHIILEYGTTIENGECLIKKAEF